LGPVGRTRAFKARKRLRRMRPSSGRASMEVLLVLLSTGGTAMRNRALSVLRARQLIVIVQESIVKNELLRRGTLQNLATPRNEGETQFKL